MKRNSIFAFVAVVILCTVFFTINAEVIHWESCPSNSQTNALNCTIHEVRVDPCREAEERKPCVLKRGRTASISFDYTAQFGGESLSSRAYWASELLDLPFLGMSTDACASTVCPAVPGQKQTYTVHLPLSKKFPARTYDLKWKLWNQQGEECCFMFPIKLQK